MGKVNRTAPRPMSRQRRKAAVEEVLTGQAPSPVSLSVAIPAKRRKAVIDAMLSRTPGASIPDGVQLRPKPSGGGGGIYGGRPSEICVADDDDQADDETPAERRSISPQEYELLESLCKIALKQRDRKTAKKK